MTAIRISLALASAAVLALAAAGPAGAAQVELSGGSTTLKLDAGTATALQSLGVAVSPVRPAKASGGGIAFPVTGGRIDPATAAGTIEHGGGLLLRAGSVRLRLTNPTITVGKSSRLSVRAGGRRIHAFTLSLRSAKVSRSGLATTVRGVRVLLSGKGASALNRTFGVSAFKKGMKIGTATVKARPAEIVFTGGATSLALDPGTAQALTSLGISAAPAAPATANTDGSLAFPITGGRVAVRTLAGEITHSGGITLTKGSTAVTVSDFTIDTAPAPKLTAALGATRFDLATLELGAAKTTVSGRDVSVGGVAAKLTQGAADVLNQAFGTTAFAGGLTIGTATVAGKAA